MTSAPRDPEELAAAGVAVGPIVAEVPAATRPGAVHLAVADLDRSIAYYESTVGLLVHERVAGRASLGAGAEDLLVLVEQPGVRSARGYCGLYHFALLVPARVDLARWLARAVRERIALVGLADHYVSEAIYLSDPDDHGIEIYWDRPRERWEGQVAQRMTTLPLDTRSLLAELEDPAHESFERLPSGAAIGHVHLRVAEVPGTIAFYRDLLGFGLMASLGAHAAFLSAGGYHHHIGANTWESAAAGQPPAGMASLRQVTILLPSETDRDRLAERVADSGQAPEAVEDGVLVRDPSGNPIVLATPAARR
jgi:catechol 2,3-dioxygenase